MSEGRSGSSPRAALLIPLALLLFVAGGWFLERLPYFGEARESMRGQAGLAGLPNDGIVGRAVARLGTTASFGATENLPSTLVMEGKDLDDEIAVLSIAADEDALHDPDSGILANMRQTGRDWERLSWVSLWEHGELVLGSRSGLRIHGDSSRYRGFPSFRLHFRPSYGASPEVGGRLLGPDADPASSVVVHVVRRRGFYPNAFVFEIAARLALPVSEFRPARVFLNGEERGIYVLTERVMPDGWGRTHFGGGGFYMYVYKGETKPPAIEAHDSLRRWVQDTRPLTMARAAERMDVENLTAHLFTLMFSFTTDWAQGAALFDRSDPEARWFWLHWDMDQSFYLRGGTDLEDWQQPVMELITLDADVDTLEEHGIVTDERHTRRHMTDVRRIVFNKLLTDPAYRKYFLDYVTEALNHRLTATFFAEVLDRYAHLERRPGVFGNVDMERYFRRRPEFVLQEVAAHFGLDPAVAVLVDSTTPATYTVDGYTQQGPYTGAYFPGQTVRIEIDDSTALLHWLVNGEVVEGSTLELVVSEHTTVRPVFHSP